jgi:hypothetical protein
MICGFAGLRSNQGRAAAPENGRRRGEASGKARTYGHHNVCLIEAGQEASELVGGLQALNDPKLGDNEGNRLDGQRPRRGPTLISRR